MLKACSILPIEIVLAPAWWHKNAGITFEDDFFYNPQRRVEVERKMEQVIYDRWGTYGLGGDKDKDLPVIGPVHLAAGYLVSEMFGCEVKYSDNAPPQVVCANRDNLKISRHDAFESDAYKRFEKLVDSLKTKYGYVVGDVNWGGILNVAIDIRGQTLFMDMFDNPDEVAVFFGEIAAVIEKFTQYVQKQTGSSSISANRTVRHFEESIFLHCQCSHTMIAVGDYEKFLMPFDIEWGKNRRPFGIHYCGRDPHRYAEAFAKLPVLDFLDVGWGGDVVELRRHLPDTFLNIRLSPVDIISQTADEIENDICRLVADSKNLTLTGVCCINMDDNVSDDKITTIFETVEKMRCEHAGQYGVQIVEVPAVKNTRDHKVGVF